jgi:hypothetical protein
MIDSLPDDKPSTPRTRVRHQGITPRFPCSGDKLTAHATQTITIVHDHNRATAYTNDGDPIGYIHLDHTKTYQGTLTPAA